MYSNCLFCHAILGRNDVIQEFPTGRRIAFDSLKSRLWVICPRCDRWNLTPLERRLDIVEACDAHFHGARKRVSTDNIALARLEGLELVRIGRAPPPEFAAWRYGPRLRRRRIEMTALTGASVIVAVGIGVSGVSRGLFGIGAVYAGSYAYSLTMTAMHHFRSRARVDVGASAFVDVRGQDLKHVRLRECDGEYVISLRRAGETFALQGALATAAIRSIAPLTNPAGGSARQVNRAVHLLQSDAGERLWPTVLETSNVPSLGVQLTSLPPERRLALEMAANEEVERRAMEGELALLERAWRDAEAIAAIADDMLLPESMSKWLQRVRKR